MSSNADVESLLESRSPDREATTSSRIIDYLLFKHGVDLGIVGWVSLIAAILNVSWAIKGFYTTQAISTAALGQSAIANQMSFLKMCLDYPQLEIGGVTAGNIEIPFGKMPCKVFMEAIDLHAMSLLLVNPKATMDNKVPPLYNPPPSQQAPPATQRGGDEDSGSIGGLIQIFNYFVLVVFISLCVLAIYCKVVDCFT